jgi:amino acid permease
VKKLSPLQTYFSLLKGFICTGILYLPKNFKNGGWAWALVSMVMSFFLTLFCMIKLLECKAKTPGGSFTDIGYKALGLKGKYLVDVFLSTAQLGFVTAYIYFIMTSLSQVIQDSFG